jgi:hypothetical protein
MASSRAKHEAASSSSSTRRHEADSLELMEAVEEWLACSHSKPDYDLARKSLSTMPLPKALPKRNLLVVKAKASMPGPAPKWKASMPGFPAPKKKSGSALLVVSPAQSLQRHKQLQSGVTPSSVSALTDDEHFNRLVNSSGEEDLAEAASLVEDTQELNELLLQRVLTLNKELEKMGGFRSASNVVAWPKAQDVSTLWEDTDDDEPAAQDERVADADPYECVSCDDAQADAEDQPEEDHPDDDDRKMCDLIARDMDAEDEPAEAGPEDDERPPCEEDDPDEDDRNMCDLPAQDMDAEDELEYVDVEELKELPQAQDKRAEDEPILKHFKTIKQTF